MRRLAYRIILPVFQLALYVVLVWYGCLYRQTWQEQLHLMTSGPAGADEWIPAWVDAPPSFAEQLAFGIDTPAGIASEIVLIPFGSLFHNGASQELAAHTTTALFVPVLWYFIGRRLERRTNAPTRPPMVEKILAIGGLSAAALVGIPVAISLAARFEGFLTGRLLILAWAIAVILASSRTIRRWRMRTIN